MTRGANSRRSLSVDAPGRERGGETTAREGRTARTLAGIGSRPVYDTIGRGYAEFRRPDPRIRERLRAAIGPATRVLNVGAGAGSYEPPGRRVVAVEPSRVMIAQRRRRPAPVVRAEAEALPFVDDSFDVAMAVLTVHHWADLRAGLREMRRVSRRQLILTYDPAVHSRYWLVADYFPQLARSPPFRPTWFRTILRELRPAVVEPIPISRDCVDGFLAAYWRRPAAYLDPARRACISAFAWMERRELRRGLTALAADLESGRWARKHHRLLAESEYDAGYRLIRTGASSPSDSPRTRRVPGGARTWPEGPSPSTFGPRLRPAEPSGRTAP